MELRVLSGWAGGTSGFCRQNIQMEIWVYVETVGRSGMCLGWDVQGTGVFQGYTVWQSVTLAVTECV